MKELLKIHPSKYHKFFDKFNTKLLPRQTVSFFAKPNVLVNDFKITDDGKYVTKALAGFKVNELIDLAN